MLCSSAMPDFRKAQAEKHKHRQGLRVREIRILNPVDFAKVII